MSATVHQLANAGYQTIAQREYHFVKETDKFYLYSWVGAPEGSKTFLTSLYIKKTEFTTGRPDVFLMSVDVPTNG